MNRFTVSLALAAACTLPVITNGCSSTDNPLSNATTTLCCSEFQVGADMSSVDFGVDASIQGQFAVLAQAASDFSSTATAMINDVTNACRGIAQDLGAAQADQDAADANTDPAVRVKAWCNLAVTSLQAAGVLNNTLTIQQPEASCDVSVSAKAKCQAQCSASGSCDVKVNPPTCSGGTMIVDCNGSCTASASASFYCKGSCDATVSGSCTVQNATVECQGRCDGSCTANDAVAEETGPQPDGTCKGLCQGTCAVVPPGVNCNGTFEGQCDGKCSASGSASVQCSGNCSADYTPITCQGGTLQGGCQVDAKCDANCNASVNAKANCTVKPLVITASADTQSIAAAIATLQTNLPNLILAVKARAQTMASIATSFENTSNLKLITDISALGVHGTACMAVIVPTLTTAGTNATAAIGAGLTVTGQVGL